MVYPRVPRASRHNIPSLTHLGWKIIEVANCGKNIAKRIRQKITNLTHRARISNAHETQTLSRRVKIPVPTSALSTRQSQHKLDQETTAVPQFTHLLSASDRTFPAVNFKQRVQSNQSTTHAKPPALLCYQSWWLYPQHLADQHFECNLILLGSDQLPFPPDHSVQQPSSYPILNSPIVHTSSTHCTARHESIQANTYCDIFRTTPKLSPLPRSLHHSETPRGFPFA